MVNWLQLPNKTCHLLSQSPPPPCPPAPGILPKNLFLAQLNSPFPLKGRLYLLHKETFKAQFIFFGGAQFILRAVLLPTQQVLAPLTLSSRSLSASHWGEGKTEVSQQGKEGGPKVKGSFRQGVNGEGPVQVEITYYVSSFQRMTGGGLRKTRVQR